jgi:hypothetical protein
MATISTGPGSAAANEQIDVGRFITLGCFEHADPLAVLRCFLEYRDRFVWSEMIPFVLFFDSVVSCLRAYSQNELSVLVSQVKAENYVWQIGERSGGSAPVTFLAGYPGDAHTNWRAALNSSEPSVVK